MFVASRLTPLIALVSLLLGVGAVIVTPREEEPQISVPLMDVIVELPGATARRSFFAGLWVDALLGTWGLHAAALTALYAVEFRIERIPFLTSAPTRIALGALAVAGVVPAWSILSGRTAGFDPSFFAIQFLFLVILTDRPRREFASV